MTQWLFHSLSFAKYYNKKTNINDKNLERGGVIHGPVHMYLWFWNEMRLRYNGDINIDRQETNTHLVYLEKLTAN